MFVVLQYNSHNDEQQNKLLSIQPTTQERSFFQMFNPNVAAIDVNLLTSLLFTNCSLHFKECGLSKQQLHKITQRLSPKVDNRYHINNNKDALHFAKNVNSDIFYMIRRKSNAGKTSRPQFCLNGERALEHTDVYICKFSKDRKSLVILSNPLGNADIMPDDINDELVIFASQQTKQEYKNRKFALLQQIRFKNIDMKNLLKKYKDF